MPFALLSFLTLAALTIPDPAGDARGDGGYILPTRPAVTEEALDLRSFSAEANGKTLRLTVSFGQLTNPWNAPSGFSAGVTDIFVKTGLGGQPKLADTGLRVRGPGGWQYHLRVTGFGSTLDSTDGTTVQHLAAPTVQVQGTSLVMNSAVPAGNYAYWVTSSIYSPLTDSGILRPTQETGALTLQAGRADAPTPVDVLAASDDRQAYTDNTLAAVGQSADRSTWLLLGLGLLGLLLTIGATVAVWRRLARR